MKFKYLIPPLVALLCLAQTPARAVDLTWSGFGTVGYAISDQDYRYQRFIDDNGGFNRDSVFGAQLDARLSQSWSATVQAKLGPSDHADKEWKTYLTWAFVSWRPSDDWMIRVGKIRLPLMLNAENYDVGATFDFARLPQEVYSISPMTDVVGVNVAKTWFGDEYDWVLEVYTGKAKSYWRFYGREQTLFQASPGSWFYPIDVQSTGLVLTVRSLDNVFRAGFHSVEVERDGANFGAPIVYQPIGGGYGVYRVGNGGSSRANVPVFTLGASVLLPWDVRLTGEFAQMKIDSVSKGLERWGAYGAASRRFGEWTPYIYYANTKSSDEALETYQAVDRNRLPSPALTNTQKVLADGIVPFDQSTLAVGTSWRVSQAGLIKTEWAHVRTGVASSFIDAPSGGNSAHQSINVFSLSYSFSF